MKKYILLIIMFSVALLTACSEKHYNEWLQIGNSYYYDANGKKMKNCSTMIENEKYSFDSSGKMLTGWQKEDGKIVYYQEDGKAIKDGWQVIDDYYFFENYHAKTGWVQDGTTFFYMDNNGKLIRNQWVDNHKYFVDENGVMLQNTTRNIEGKNYVFDANGNGVEKVIDIIGIPYSVAVAKNPVTYTDEVICTITDMTYDANTGLITYHGSYYAAPKAKMANYYNNRGAMIEYKLINTNGYSENGEFWTGDGDVGDKFERTFSLGKNLNGSTLKIIK